MKPYERSEDGERLWYKEGIDRWYHGVFEGGGARAVAYPGALEALAECRAWFASVTGSSAGAITAAFIGSGAEAGAARAFTKEMFELVGVSRVDGLVRLLRTGGFFPGDELRDWLDEQLAAQLKRVTHRAFEQPVTFDMLFAVSGIETFVVATDISLRQPIVFSHRSTPRCSVAEAIVASSSTPVAFESRLLVVPRRGDAEMKHHTIVDGGLWSNFPTYVLTDAAFRRHYGLEPVKTDEADIVAFRLSQKLEDEVAPSPAIAFRAGGDDVDAYEWSVARPPVRGDGGRRWLAALLAPFAILARLLDLTDKRHHGRWPPPKHGWMKRLVDGVDGIFGALAPWPVAALVFLLVTGGAALGIIELALELASRGYSAWVAAGACAGAALIALPLLVLLALGLVANSLLLKPARATLYGLVSTYAASGRSRAWDAERPYVITLDVPDKVTPISFAEAIELQNEIADDARRRTLERLGGALRRTA